jgi:hypothetical protein
MSIDKGTSSWMKNIKYPINGGGRDTYIADRYHDFKM